MKINIIESFSDMKNTNLILDSVEKGSHLDRLAYISSNCSPYDFIYISALFFPPVVIVEDCCILEFYYTEENFLDAVKTYGADKRKIEESMNNTIIYDVFGGFNGKVPDLVFEEIGKIIEHSWRITLRERIPDREFVVRYFHEEQDYGPIVTFFQK